MSFMETLKHFRIDVRCLIVAFILLTVFMFHVLMSQYDSLFTPTNDVSHHLQLFTSSSSSSAVSNSNSNSSIHSPSIATHYEHGNIAVNIADRRNADYVVVGYCCQTHDYDLSLPCKPQQFVIAIAEGTFLSINKRIIYQQCTQSGLAPLFMRNASNAVTLTEQVWRVPDILLCQGYFYDNRIIAHREHLSHAQRITIDIEQEMRRYHHMDVAYDIDNYNPNAVMDVDAIEYANNLKYSIRLSRSNTQLWQHHNRSFLTTYNTEYWGGGQCTRYDIIFESVFDRTLHGCVTVYIPPAFYFESERVYNHTQQLILPSTVVYNNHASSLSTAQQQYIESITAFKDRDKFALFLVRDCFLSRYHVDAVLRPIFFDLLSSTYKNATALGGCRRNKAAYKALGWQYCPKNSFDGHYINNLKYNCSGYGWTDGVVQMARPYKFFITFENSKIKGYSTEKIFNALYANAVPIYFGDPMITQYLNPRKFIHCNTISDEKIKRLRSMDKQLNAEELIQKVQPLVYEDMMRCVEKVRAVDQDDALYHRMLLEPVFVNNTYRNTVMDPEIIGT
eukprot:CAMPEP_0202733706 /NCGR_PEP_ID=MMETSP1385-20130828/188305_1 /ASSEMBLY_ACC=CAM_ASM_000861 /TAXON_ID=933848 /ORGANISM="Elphidium margaritaceum" /LENGTH=561 /DNA_ID=CAMNT_0049400045 /DNA_START=488 /DNA_END=2169 /DNA_ORIENTATION=+